MGHTKAPEFWETDLPTPLLSGLWLARGPAGVGGSPKPERGQGYQRRAPDKSLPIGNRGARQGGGLGEGEWSQPRVGTWPRDVLPRCCPGATCAGRSGWTHFLGGGTEHLLLPRTAGWRPWPPRCRPADMGNRALACRLCTPGPAARAAPASPCPAAGGRRAAGGKRDAGGAGHLGATRSSPVPPHSAAHLRNSGPRSGYVTPSARPLADSCRAPERARASALLPAPQGARAATSLPDPELLAAGLPAPDRPHSGPSAAGGRGESVTARASAVWPHLWGTSSSYSGSALAP